MSLSDPIAVLGGRQVGEDGAVYRLRGSLNAPSAKHSARCS